MNELTGSKSRFAIYYAPEPGTTLHHIGTTWLGRDLSGDDPVTPDLPAEISPEEWLEATASARRYGFHATLKPPFHLAEGSQLVNLRSALRDFTACQPALHCAPLIVRQLGSFLALTTSQPCPDLHQLAADCVRHFEPFRLRLTEAETMQRRHSSMTTAELKNLAQWGYPYVLDTWQFHMTLTSSLAPEPRQLFYAHLEDRFSQTDTRPLSISSLCLLEESQPGANFKIVERFPLAK